MFTDKYPNTIKMMIILYTINDLLYSNVKNTSKMNDSCCSYLFYNYIYFKFFYSKELEKLDFLKNKKRLLNYLNCLIIIVLNFF